MIILDSNVVSEVMGPRPDEKVLTWLDRQFRSSIWITSITEFEIRFGLNIMPSGNRRDAYSAGFESLLERIDHRIAAFDTDAAHRASALMASRRMQGRPREDRDTMIAGIVLSRQATLATRNVRDFEDMDAVVVDPWV